MREPCVLEVNHTTMTMLQAVPPGDQHEPTPRHQQKTDEQPREEDSVSWSGFSVLLILQLLLFALLIFLGNGCFGD